MSERNFILIILIFVNCASIAQGFKDRENLYNLGLKYHIQGQYDSAYNTFIKAEVGYHEKKSTLMLGLYMQGGYKQVGDYIASTEYFKVAYERGEVKALYFFEPDSFSEDVEAAKKNAFQEILQLARAGNTFWKYYAGMCYKDGWGTEVDHSKYIYWIKESAYDEFNESIYELGKAYEFGLGIKSDSSLALFNYKKAADLKCSAAILALGFFYDNGMFFTKDVSKAKQYFEKAALEYHNPVAYYNLGNYWSQGIGVPKKLDIAYSKYYIPSAKAGLPEACSKLAYGYEKGVKQVSKYLGTMVVLEQDLHKAMRLYKIPAENEDTLAIARLGDYYLSPKQSRLSASVDKSIKYFNEGVRLGNTYCKTRLLYIYLYEESYIDYNKANSFLAELIEKNNAKAHFYQGEIYRLGLGVEKDPTKAFEWTKKAAELNDATAQNNLAVMYNYGIGTNKNLDLSRYWYREAMKNGSEIAKENYKSQNSYSYSGSGNCTCTQCNGGGRELQSMGNNGGGSYRTCSVCGGDGKISCN